MSVRQKRSSYTARGVCVCVKFDSNGIAASADDFAVAISIDRFTVAGDFIDGVLDGTGMDHDGLGAGQYRNSVGNGIRPSKFTGQGRKGYDDQCRYRRPAELRHG